MPQEVAKKIVTVFQESPKDSSKEEYVGKSSPSSVCSDLSSSKEILVEPVSHKTSLDHPPIVIPSVIPLKDEKKEIVKQAPPPPSFPSLSQLINLTLQNEFLDSFHILCAQIYPNANLSPSGVELVRNYILYVAGHLLQNSIQGGPDLDSRKITLESLIQEVKKSWENQMSQFALKEFYRHRSLYPNGRLILIPSFFQSLLENNLFAKPENIDNETGLFLSVMLEYLAAEIIEIGGKHLPPLEDINALSIKIAVSKDLGLNCILRDYSCPNLSSQNQKFLGEWKNQVDNMIK